MSVAGVGFAVAFTLVILGLYSSFKFKAAEYVSSIDADVWVGPAGMPMNLIANMGSLPLDARDGIELIDGVQSVRPFDGRLTVLNRDRGIEQRTYVIGVDVEVPLAAPPNVRGQRVPGPGQVIIDNVYARRKGLRIGEDFMLKGQKLRIVGLSSGTDLMGTPYTFVDISTAQRIFESDLTLYAPELLGVTDGLTSFFLVKTEEGADRAAVVRRIQEAGPEFQPLTREQFVTANLADVRQGLEPLIWVLVLISFAIGAAIIALTIYTATIEKAKEYGVLKAIGFSNAKLLRVVGAQSVVAALLGFLSGTVLAVILSTLLRVKYPMFTTRFTMPALTGMLAMCVFMSMAAALVPARRIASIDPAEVFRV